MTAGREESTYGGRVSLDEPLLRRSCICPGSSTESNDAVPVRIYRSDMGSKQM